MVFQSVFLNLKQKTSLAPCQCTELNFFNQHVLELLFMGGSTWTHLTSYLRKRPHF
jgi:hypothetical protein